MIEKREWDDDASRRVKNDKFLKNSHFGYSKWPKLGQGGRKRLIITYPVLWETFSLHIQWFYDIFRILRLSILGKARHDPWHAPTIINVSKNGTKGFGYKFCEKSRSFVTFEMRLDSIRSFLRTWGLPKAPPGYDRVKGPVVSHVVASPNNLQPWRIVTPDDLYPDDLQPKEKQVIHFKDTR